LEETSGSGYDELSDRSQLKLVSWLVFLAAVVVFLMCAASAALGFWAGVTKSPPIIIQGKASDITMTPTFTIKPSIQVDVPPSKTVIENQVVVPEGPPPVITINVPEQPPPVINVQTPVVSASGKTGEAKVLYDPALHAKLDDINRKLQDEGKLLPPPKDTKKE